jgi:hypothetical protein
MKDMDCEMHKKYWLYIFRERDHFRNVDLVDRIIIK